MWLSFCQSLPFSKDPAMAKEEEFVAPFVIIVINEIGIIIFHSDNDGPLHH
jgi:hypothetical protein